MIAATTSGGTPKRARTRSSTRPVLAGECRTAADSGRGVTKISR